IRAARNSPYLKQLETTSGGLIMLRRFLFTFSALVLLITGALGYSHTTHRPKITSDYQDRTSQAKFHWVPNAVSGKYVVTVADKVSQSEVASVANTLVRVYGGELDYIYGDVIKGFSVKGMTATQ